MANNYSQFSESIAGITPLEAEWMETVLGLDATDTEQLVQLKRELDIQPDFDCDLDNWPDFGWEIGGATECDLWLHSDEGFTEGHLIHFVQSFFRRHRPNGVISVTGADTCSKPRIGEFGGWWLVIAAYEVVGGSSWNAAADAVEAIEAKRNEAIANAP